MRTELSSCSWVWSIPYCIIRFPFAAIVSIREQVLPFLKMGVLPFKQNASSEMNWMKSDKKEYDIALSFAGEDRVYVEQVADYLKEHGVNVFYDKFEVTRLWGKNLYNHLSEIYREKARYTVVFISKSYREKLWTNHELRSAQARAFQESREYILPVRFDDTEISGIELTTAYIDAKRITPIKLAEMIVEKLKDVDSTRIHLSSEAASTITTNPTTQNLRKKVTTVTPISLSSPSKQSDTGEKPRTWLDIRSKLPFILSEIRAKVPRLYVVISITLLLVLAIIGTNYLLTHRTVSNEDNKAPSDKLLSNNASAAPDNKTALSEVTDPQLVPFLKGLKFGFIDSNKNLVIDAKYDEVHPFYEGLAMVKLHNRCGFIDKTGTLIIPLKYESTGSFSEGLVPVRLNGKVGFIDRTDAEVIPFKYEVAQMFIGGLARVSLKGKYGFIDKEGTVIIPLKYEDMNNFSDGLAMATLNGKVGFIDKTGTVVIPLKYEGATDFSEGLAGIGQNSRTGFIDKTGTVVIPLKYEGIGTFSEGLANIRQNGKWGFINKKGTMIILPRYDEVSSFSEGLAGIKLNKKWGFIDKTGTVVIPLKYNHTYLFDRGLALVTLSGKSFFIDKSGTEYYEK